MQVLMKKNLEKLGQIGDVVTVKSGYARNYLLPLGLAVPLTDANRKLMEIEKQKHQNFLTKREEELSHLGEKLAAASVTIQSKANEEGHLFGSVSAQQIAEALNDEGYPVEARMVQLETPIKEVGVYEVPVQLKPDLTATTKVWVVGE